MNKTAANVSDFVNPEIPGEYFISEHTFFYIKEGTTKCYDGSKTQIFKSNEFGLIRKNRLAKYSKEKPAAESQTVFIIFDESFLKKFQEKYKVKIEKFTSSSTFIPIKYNQKISECTLSLSMHYHSSGKAQDRLADTKQEELLLAILNSQPELSGVFFDFGIPEKINLEAFMNKNYMFNVSIPRFAYLTGRSLSAFKRDFKTTLNKTPNRWLVQKRLEEAYFLIDKKGKKPSEIYLDLGFETLQHFSFAFKKQFGMTLTDLVEQKNTSNLFAGTRKN